MNAGTITDAVANERGMLVADFLIQGARAFVRLVITTTMSAGATDTADYVAAAVFGGQDTLPAVAGS